jgi:MFS family permease
MVVLGFVAYNTVLGLPSGAFSVVLPTLQQELGATRAQTSAAFGLMLLAIGTIAPIVGNVLRHVRLRTVMTLGAALCGIGFAVLAYAQTLIEVWLAFGGLVGTGACLIGVISAPTLIGRWFEHNRGKALGLTMMPLLILVAPPITKALLAVGGRPLPFLALAGLFVILAPVLWFFIIDRPEDVGQTPLRAPDMAERVVEHAATAQPVKTSREILADSRFWLLSIAIGILTAAGIAFVSHGSPIALDKGFDAWTASATVSTYGLGTLLGALFYGWLIDRIGPFRALVACMTVAAAVWLIFAGVSSVPPILALALLMGTGGGATVALHSAAMTEIFGRESFSRAIGYSYFVKIPFLFGGAPVAGYLYDQSGHYFSTLLFYAGALAVATAVSAVLAFDRRNPRRAASPAMGLS